MKRSLVLLAGAVVLAVALTACGGDDSTTAGTTTQAEESGAPSGEPIKIGTSLPLTGDFSEPGTDAKKGLEVWVKVVNDNGGLLGRPVELIVRDDASDQNLVVADYNHLISQEKVDLLLGTFSSFLNLPASAVAERNKMLYIETAGGSPEMFERGFKFLFFTQNAPGAEQADPFADWVKSLPDGEKPATAALVTVDDPFTAPVIERLKELLTEAGVEVVFDEIYPPDTTNFDSIASAINALEPDLIAQGSVFNDGVGLVRALITVGAQPKQFFQTTAPTLTEQYAKAIGADNTEGIFSSLSWDEDLDTAGNADFVAAHEEMFGAQPLEEAAAAFANAQVLQAAVEAIGNVEDQEAMADWLHSNEVETILGPISWDEVGRPQGSYILAQWQSGDLEIVAPADMATSESVVNPKPEWK